MKRPRVLIEEWLPAAAIVAADEVPSSLTIVTLDARQAEAAEREGFRVLGAVTPSRGPAPKAGR